MVQANIVYYHFQLFLVLAITLVVYESNLSIRLFCYMCLLCYHYYVHFSAISQ